MLRVSALSLAVLVGMTAAVTAEAAQSHEGVVSASTLKRTHTIPPAWPASAPTGVEGWVMLEFTLLPDGTVSDIEVKESHPAGVFDTSAVEALRQWKYEPVERAGQKVAQRAEIRMKYALAK
ncbi:energy transducer TonB [Steroidobacter sp. S1-65]|uniref:Energy transducer TonB n=2 Tax=Steroidobacter gossypii TaxID=2805490 RepID=A0ABS1X0Z4_9GAMM|nr:energy transducer TonB [Steroidobacter gossypii]